MGSRVAPVIESREDGRCRARPPSNWVESREWTSRPMGGGFFLLAAEIEEE